jgi:hypothetical protein
MQIPDSLKPLVSDLVSRVEKKARDEGQMYFNGPNTRLLRVTHERAHQASSGKEDPGYVLELAPISWEEYCVLHNFLDDTSVFPEKNEGANTIRKQFASTDA